MFVRVMCDVLSSCFRTSLLPEGKGGLVWERNTAKSVQGFVSEPM